MDERVRLPPSSSSSSSSRVAPFQCSRLSIGVGSDTSHHPSAYYSTLYCPSVTLGVTHVFAPEPELLGQLVHHVLEDDRIHVLAEQVEEEPVADHGLLYDDVEALGFDPSKPDRLRRRRSTPRQFKLKLDGCKLKFV